MRQGTLVRVGIYARISENRSDEARGTERQIALAREVIARHADEGWAEVAVFADDSISAARGDEKDRPGYNDAIRWVERGELDLLLVYQTSRAWREDEQRARAYKLLRRKRVRLAQTRGAEVDLQTASGRLNAGITGLLDTAESGFKSERVQDQKMERARAGRYAGGGFRPFGYTLEYDRPPFDEITGERQKRKIRKMTPHPTEAEIVREAARRALDLESLISITRDLNARGVTTTTGKPMQSDRLRRILASALISGRREVVHREDHVGRARPLCGEIVADGDWDPIISVEDSDALRAMLSAPARRSHPGGARKTLLSGILLCGRCGHPMVSRPRVDKPRYVCNRAPGRPGCGRMSVGRNPADDLIGSWVAFKISQPDLLGRLRKHRRSRAVDVGLQEQADALQAKLDRLVDLYTDGEIDRATYNERKSATAPELERVQAAIAAASPQADRALDRLERMAQRGAQAGYERTLEAWRALDDAQRRPLLQAMLSSITCNPTDVNTRFDPFRFAPVWNEWADLEAAA